MAAEESQRWITDPDKLSQRFPAQFLDILQVHFKSDPLSLTLTHEPYSLESIVFFTFLDKFLVVECIIVYEPANSRYVSTETGKIERRSSFSVFQPSSPFCGSGP